MPLAESAYQFIYRPGGRGCCSRGCKLQWAAIFPQAWERECAKIHGRVLAELTAEYIA